MIHHNVYGLSSSKTGILPSDKNHEEETAGENDGVCGTVWRGWVRVPRSGDIQAGTEDHEGVTGSP